MHRNVSKHKCPTCERIFVSVSSLRDHTNSHSGLRPYVCDKCGKSFYSSPIHNKRDSALGRYKCSYCAKRFRYKGAVNTHMELCLARPQMTTVLHIENIQ
ncbi:Uncharacterized protein FKW44_016082 [Caligus rogercresseyi]|uniref:C2H2-type domain-containing protein n=1 Tax=Caligus rogercresseyi TaxID=217165 RepID=A0A7T8K070_CALRO|nr:Uncharacterized protein FKW44_016082 [Caligus rogercresseyi]